MYIKNGYSKRNTSVTTSTAKMKTAFVLLVAAAFTVQLSTQQSCHLREIDLCVATPIVALGNKVIPQNQDDIDEQCKVARETVGCFRNYTDKCTTQVQRELVNFVTQSGQQSLDDYCTAGSPLSKSVLEKSECLTQAWEEQSSCLNDVRAGVESISNAPPEKRLDVLCCAYRRYRKCALDVARSKCGNDIENFINRITSLIVGNLPKLVCSDCGDFESKCGGLLPAPGTPPKGDSDSPIAQLFSAYLDN